MSTIKASGLGPLTASNTATIVDPATPLNGIARMSPLVSFSPVTVSGTSVDFTGIPSWARRITVMFNGVSTNGTSIPLLQVGSGSITTSGYTSGSVNGAGGSSLSGGSSTAGFILNSGAATNFLHGHVILTNVGSNTWICSLTLLLATNAGDRYFIVGGGSSSSLSGTLDRVRLTTVNGTDTFDAGKVNVMYE